MAGKQRGLACLAAPTLLLLLLVCGSEHHAEGRAGELPSVETPLSYIFFANLSPSSLKSEVIPIATELVARGHKISIASPIMTPDIKARAKANMEMVAIPMDMSLVAPMSQGVLEWSNLSLVGPKTQHWKTLAMLSSFWKAGGVFYKDYARGARQVLAERPRPDLMMIHGFDDGFIDIANSMDVPYMIFHPMPLGWKGYGSPIGVPDGLLGGPAAAAGSFKTRLTQLASRVYLAVQFYIGGLKQNADRRELGLRTFTNPAALWQEHMVLSTWSLGLEPSRMQSPLLQQVGFPSLPYAAPAEGLPEADADLAAWLDGCKGGLIYVAYGSLMAVGPMMKAANHRALLASITAFAVRRDAKVLVAARGDPAVLQEAVDDALHFANAANGTIRSETWVNQRMVLAHPATKIFVSHTGQMSVGDAVMSITPILATPICCDQATNAVRCEDAGIGLTLDPHHFSDAEAAEKLQQLWTNDSFIAALQYHHKINMQGKGPIHRAADVIERALAVGTQHLIPFEQTLPWLARNSIDLIACLLVVLGVGVYVAVQVSRLLFPLPSDNGSLRKHLSVSSEGKKSQ